jgi:hypothetical protein
MKTVELNQPTKVKKVKAKGYILFEGKSNIDGQDIVGILTLKTANKKTGQMAQLWIMRSDINPVEASKQGLDGSVCGQCKLRQSLGGACYVNLGQAPNAVFKAYKNGNYSFLSMDDYEALEGLKIRFGAYGDPYALPINILAMLKAYAKNNTSYTHQWRKGDDILKSVSMASVDNIAEQVEATNSGWRTFRVATVTDNKVDLMDNEIICPNVTKGISCADCGLCSGASKEAKNIVVPVHGSWSKRFKE